jgi:hypothetical protein
MAYQGRHRLVEIYRGMSKKAKVATVSGILIAGIGGTTLAASATTTASTAISGSITATTTVTNHPDNGGAGQWATDAYTRTLTVSPAAASVCSGDTILKAGFSAAIDSCYVATVSDTGTFKTIVGAKAPDQGSPASNAVIGSIVEGTFTGGATYDVYALNTDILTNSTVLKTQDGTPTGFGTTSGTWPEQAFSVTGGAPAADAKAAYTTGGVDWSWTYKTACESWVDAGTSGDGQVPGDGNITGLQNCTDTPATVPTVSNGHVLTVNNNRATVAWTESSTGWPGTNKCEEIWINGPGFGTWNSADPTNPGTAHVGFTCDNGAGTNFGYLSGLEAGHLYALRIVPATGTYGSHQPIPGAAVGYVDVFTTR